MITLFASLVTDVESAFVWLFTMVHAVVSDVASVPGAVAALF